MERTQKNYAAFFKKRKNALLAAACYAGTATFIAGLFFLALFLLGVYPFSQTYMSAYDLNAQIAPLLEHFFDVFSGKSSLFYTYSLAGGMDMFGSLVYCCVSPFTFIYFFFGSGRVCYGTSFVLPLKLACVSLAALYYLRKRFKNIPAFIQCMLAVCYTYCGYLFVCNTYINWVDLLIYLPFLAAGFKKLIVSGKKFAFAVPLALMLYTSFSITAFSLFIIFPIMLAYVFFNFGAECEKSVKITKVCDICFALVLAVAMALPVMLPSFAVFASSGRRGGIFENLLNDLSADPLYYKFSYILTDGFTLSLTLYYFAKHGISNKKAKFFGFAFVLSMLPVLCDECMLLLNFGSYMSYALRFGFVNGFYFFFVAATVLNEEFERFYQIKRAKNGCERGVLTCEISESAVENGAEPRGATLANPRAESLQKTSFFKRVLSKKSVYISAISLVGVGVVIGWYFLYRGLENETYINAFAGRFAHSLGGLEATCLIFAGILCVLAAGFPFISGGKLSYKPLVAACAVILCCQVCFYDYALVKGNSSDYTDLAEIGGITDLIGEEGDGYGRVKLGWDYVSADAPLTLRTNSFTVFSSMVDETNFAPTNFFGYGGNGKNVMRSYNGTLLGDCLLGYEYFITKVGTGLPCYTENPAYKSINGTYKAYKNEWVFPHAFKVKGNNLGELAHGTVADYNELLCFLGAQTPVCEHAAEKVEKWESANGVFRIRFKYHEAGDMFIVCNAPDGVSLKYCIGSWKEEETKNLSGGQIFRTGHGGGYTYSVYVRAEGETELDKQTVQSWFSSFIVADESVKEALENANNNAAKMQLAPNVISAEVTAEDGEYLFLNYIALKGHTAFVNGKKVELEKNGLNFMLLKLERGKNEVKIVYSSPYVGYALAGAVIGLFLVFAVLFIYRFKKVKLFVFGGIYYAAIALCLAVLAFFFIMPLILMLFKAVKSGVLGVLGLFFK